MASTILETLRNTEYGRKNCIKNAKLAKLNATDNMSIYDLGELFLQQNNTETLNKNDTSIGGGWQRPDDWWDTKSILASAEEKDGLYPAYILLLADTDITTTFTKTTTNMALQGDGYLTSDGAWYTEDGSVHTWDTTKDKECSEGYKTRYVIVYVADPTNIPKIDLRKFNCLEFVAGNITLGTDNLIFGAGSVSNANQEIISIESLETTAWDKIQTQFFASYCCNLKNVSLPALTTISGSSTFSSCSSLTSVSLPALTTISGSSTFSSCSSLTSVSLPALTTISREYTFYNCSSLTSVSLPALTTISGSQTFNNCSSLTSVSLPALTTISGSQTFNNCYSLTSVSLPALTTISGSSTFNNCYSLTSYEFLSTLLEVNTSAMFNNCYFLKNISLFNEWSFSGLNVSYSNLTKTCLNDMLDKLADVTELEDTYTLTLGETNLAKLTEDEIAVGTNKGWVIS